jgi:hypothetical protein
MNQIAWILSSVVNIQLKIHHRSKEPQDSINLHHISCRSSFWLIAPRARFRPERRLLDSAREAIMNCMEGAAATHRLETGGTFVFGRDGGQETGVGRWLRVEQGSASTARGTHGYVEGTTLGISCETAAALIKPGE